MENTLIRGGVPDTAGVGGGVLGQEGFEGLFVVFRRPCVDYAPRLQVCVCVCVCVCLCVCVCYICICIVVSAAVCSDSYQSCYLFLKIRARAPAS